mgnify:CR=1 FL=1
MKTTGFILVLTFIIIGVIEGQSPQNGSDTGTLTILISGLQNDNGDVRIGLFNSEESFKGQTEKFKGTIIKPEHKMATWKIEDLPFGYYAVKVFHDEDQDDEIDRKFGIPSEGFGFSNNPGILYGPPGFDKTKFLFNSDSMTIEIKLIIF